MSRPSLTVRHAVLRLIPSYRCIDCGKVADGSPLVTIEVDHVCAPHDLPEYVERARVSNAHMPIGWAGYGLDIHRCPDCS